MSTDEIDVMAELARLRPSTTTLDEQWPIDVRARLLDDIRLRHRPTRRPRRRAVVLSAFAVVAAVVAIAVPVLLPSGTPGGASPAAAAALKQLADVAADTPADVAGPGEFVHTVVRNHQVGVFLDNDPDDATRDLDDRYESWTGSDGRTWRRDTSVAASQDGTVLRRGSDVLFFPAGAEEAGRFGETGSPYGSPLPTDADRLETYLRSRVQGSNSRDEAMFLALGDILRGTTAPAALRSAALTVLARVDHVTLGGSTRDSQGRGVRELVFEDGSVRAGVVQSFFVDPRTAQLVEERITSDDLVSTTTTLTSEVVASVPPEVVRTAEPQD